MKKLLVMFTCILLIVGCSLTNNTPNKKTKEFLNRYSSLNEGVISDLNLSSEMSGLTTEEHKEKYIGVMKRQYQDMFYEIVEEEVNGDEAVVEVKISVYDLFKARNTAENYTFSNPSEFYVSETDNTRDITKVNEYILEELNKTNEKVDYTIEVNLVKKDGKWEVREFDTVTKEKLHGTYNYEVDNSLSE